MTDSEAIKAFDDLRAVVDASHLSWIISYVDEEIQRGKPGTRRLQKSPDSVAYYIEIAMPRPGRTRKIEEFTTVTPFTPAEKFQLLVASIERVLEEVPRLSQAAAGQMQEMGARSVTFADEESGREFTIDPVLDTREHLRQLRAFFEAAKS